MKRVTSILILAAACLCLWGACRLHRSFMNERTLCRSAYSAPLENMSPLMAFTTVALGGFRGIIVDMLWMRAAGLQDKGEFFELAQLADWITKLEPHFTPVWAFHAWNMAYNISFLFPEPEDRWRWVQHGIQLIRDEGLRLNPGDPSLYWELAWLYQHKIGFVMDKAHWYYKIRLARDMMTLFDGPRPDYKAQASDPRLRRLREEYKLLPEVMKTIDDKYGPLDWRLPESHAMYWAYRGHELAPGSRSARNCERTIFQSISQAFRQGKLCFDPETGLFVTTPNLELLPNAIKSYEEALARYDLVTFHLANANFLGEAVMILYVYNRVEQAEKLFETLERKYPGSNGDLGFEGFIERSLKRDLADTAREDAMAMVEGFMFQSYLCMARGDKDRSVNLEQLSKRIWNEYMNSRVSEDHRDRTGLPPWPVIQRQAYERATNEQAQIPAARDYRPPHTPLIAPMESGIPFAPSSDANNIRDQQP